MLASSIFLGPRKSRSTIGKGEENEWEICQIIEKLMTKSTSPGLVKKKRPDPGQNIGKSVHYVPPQ